MTIEEKRAKQREFKREWRSTPSGKLSESRSCRLYKAKNIQRVKAKQKEWREANADKVRANKRRMAYGITPEQVEALRAQQCNKCATCGDEFSCEPCVDHSHKTGLIRGLLCKGCNLCIGHAKDSPSRLRVMADYLERKNGA